MSDTDVPSHDLDANAAKDVDDARTTDPGVTNDLSDSAGRGRRAAGTAFDSEETGEMEGPDVERSDDDKPPVAVGNTDLDDSADSYVSPARTDEQQQQ